MSTDLAGCGTWSRKSVLATVIGVSLLLLPFGAAAADSFQDSLIAIEIKGQGSAKSLALAVALGADTLVTSCTSISEAVSVDAVVERKRIPMTLTASLPLENLCRLSGQIGPTKQLVSSRAAMKVGSPVTVYMLDAQAGSAWKSASVTINRKLDGGTNRVVFVDPQSVSSQTNLPLTSGGAAFDKDAKLVGLVSSIPGSSDMAGIVMLEDLERARWFAADPDTSAAKSKTKQLSPAAQLGPVRGRLGLGLTYVDLANTYVRVHNNAKLLTMAEKWTAEDGNNPAPHVVAAFALAELKFPDKGFVEIEKAMALSPNYLLAFSAIAAMKARQGRVTEADIAWSKALAIESRDSLDDALRVGFLISLKRNEEALALAQKLFQDEPKALYVQYALCRATIVAGQRDRSVEVCRQYAEDAPDNISGWIALSVAYQGQGRLDDALAAAKKAIEINPEVAESWSALGVIAEAKGETQRANEAEQRIRDLDPTILERFSKNRAAQGCYRNWRNQVHGDAAINSCREAARLDDQNAGVQGTLGVALLYEKRLDEGIAAHENAVRLNPTLKGSWAALTQAYAQKHDASKTRTALEHLRSLDSTAADAVYAKVRNVLN